MQSALDQAVHEACEDFVKNLDALNAEPYLRDAIVKMAIRDVVWMVLDTFTNQHELADHLELMAGAVRDHRDEVED